jgi:hypothetical protein
MGNGLGIEIKVEIQCCILDKHLKLSDYSILIAQIRPK